MPTGVDAVPDAAMPTTEDVLDTNDVTVCTSLDAYAVHWMHSVPAATHVHVTQTPGVLCCMSAVPDADYLPVASPYTGAVPDVEVIPAVPMHKLYQMFLSLTAKCCTSFRCCISLGPFT